MVFHSRLFSFVLLSLFFTGGVTGYSAAQGNHYADRAVSVAFLDSEGWTYSKLITIDHTKVTNDLLGFPLLVSTTDADLAAHAQTDADDIFFTLEDGTRLFHEIEHYDSTTGQLVAWIKVDSLSSTEDTELYMYYGNEEPESQAEPDSVWNEYFRVVQHLHETPANDETGHFDSSPCNNDGSPHNFDGTGFSTTDAKGWIDGADIFDGDDDYVFIPDSPTLGLPVNQGSISAWVRWSIEPSEGNSWANVVCKNYDYSYQFQHSNHNTYFEGALQTNTGRRYVFSTTSPEKDVWYYVAGTYDGTELSVYVNGEFENSGSLTGTVNPSNTDLQIGRRHNANGWSDRHFAGTIDEVRVSVIARPPEWIKTCYNNQYNPASFMSFGEEIQEICERDMATVRIVTPEHHISSEPVTPSAVIANYSYGGEADSCYAICRITGSGVDYEENNLEGVAYLEPGEKTMVEFPEWTPPGGTGEQYWITVTAYLQPEEPTDSDPSNDTKQENCWISNPHEVSPTTILIPKPGAEVDRMNPTAYFRNLGYDFSQNFYCHCEVTASSYNTAPYHDSFLVAFPLPSGDSMPMAFADWTCDDSLFYTARFYAANATGDLVSIPVEVAFNGLPWVGTAEDQAEPYIEVAERGIITDRATLNYCLPSSTPTRICVYNVVGQVVHTIHEGTLSGTGTLSWNGTDDAGRRLSNGLYFIRITTPEITRSAKVVMLR